MESLHNYFEKIFAEDKPVKLIFSGKRRKSADVSKVTLRPVMLSGSLCYQAEYSFARKVTHTNIEAAHAAEFCCDLIKSDFKQANIFTPSQEIQILAAKPDKPRITGRPSSLKCADISHNRQKQYIIPDGQPCDFLIALGVMGKDGRVFQRHYAKFRQINRFLEIVDDVSYALPEAGERPLKIIDFRCGKAYLTFAVYYYLKILQNKNVEIIGLDLKQDVIDFCNSTADSLGYKGLTFMMGDIADYTDDYADMVITLHACDTATDYALINAVSWNSSVILSVPCCQHELFIQIKNDLHQPMLKHGILKDRLTETLQTASEPLSWKAEDTTSLSLSLQASSIQHAT